MKRITRLFNGIGGRIALAVALIFGVFAGWIDAAVAGLVAAALTVKAIESQGITLSYSVAGSPSAFSTIMNVVGFSGPGGSASVIDVTNLASLAKEKMMGLPDEGQFTIDVNLDPDDASHVALRNARSARTRTEFKITFTDAAPASTAAFYGYVLGFQIKGQVDQQVTTAITIEIDGAVSWA